MNGRVAAILLAAGQSRRMGSCKQLLPLGNSTVIGCCLETLVAAGVNDIVVVVSREGGAVAAEAASHYPVRIAVNPLADGDMASSVRVGRDSVAPENSGVIIALCDCPLVHPETVTGLMARHINVPDRVVIPSHAGRSGHPLLIPMPLLEELTDGLILRDLLRFNPDRIEYLEVTDPGILVDMDTPEDYQQVARMRASRT